MADMANLEARVKDIIAEELGVEREKLTNEASFMEDLGADRRHQPEAGDDDPPLHYFASIR